MSRYLKSLFAIIVTIAISGIVGFYFGAKSVTIPQSDPVVGAQSKQLAEYSGTKKEDKGEVTVEELAKQKAVPAMISAPKGDYTLVSVIEGGDLNQQLTKNLQLVTLQRKQLKSLATQFEQVPVSGTQQRELIAGQINEVRNALRGNLQLMAKSYAYSLDYSYLRIAHQVSLLIKKQVDGKVYQQLEHEFKTAAEFREFKKKSDAYLRLKMELAQEDKLQASNPDQQGLSKDGTAIVSRDKDEVARKREEMMSSYNFDPERQYDLQYNKTALYARPVK